MNYLILLMGFAAALFGTISAIGYMLVVSLHPTKAYESPSQLLIHCIMASLGYTIVIFALSKIFGVTL